MLTTDVEKLYTQPWLHMMEAEDFHKWREYKELWFRASFMGAEFFLGGGQQARHGQNWFGERRSSVTFGIKANLQANHRMVCHPSSYPLETRRCPMICWLGLLSAGGWGSTAVAQEWGGLTGGGTLVLLQDMAGHLLGLAGSCVLNERC